MSAELKRIIAKIAYQQACEAILKAHTPIIDKAFEKIHNAIKEGYTHVVFHFNNFYGDFSESEIVELRKTQKYFEALGYSFKIDSTSMNTCVITIDWSKNL